MARSVAELQAEMDSLGLSYAGMKGKEPMMNALAAYYIKEQGLAPVHQVEPMLARDAKEWFDRDCENPFASAEMNVRFWDNPRWTAEEKMDGNRFKFHVLEGKNRFDSRRRSDVNFIFNEKTENFPHLNSLDLPEWEGTILDGEIICKKAVVDTGDTVTARTTQSTSAIANSGPEKAVQIQENNDAWVYYCVFDIIRYKGQDVTGKPYRERRELYKEVVESIDCPYVECVIGSDTGKLDLLMEILERGGEGVMLKDLNAPYQPGKRSKGMYKVKEYVTTDAFVTGYIPGDHGFAGLVGALELSVYRGGSIAPIGSISAIPLEERKAMSAEDGSLKPEFYGNVYEIKGQALSKNGRFLHCVPLRKRPDKTEEMCTVDW